MSPQYTESCHTAPHLVGTCFCLQKPVVQVVILQPTGDTIASYLVTVNWYFEPTQPQRDYITAKNNVQSVSYLLCTQVIKSQIIQKPQNQSCTQIHMKQNIHKHRTQNFRRICPFGTTPVKKST